MQFVGECLEDFLKIESLQTEWSIVRLDYDPLKPLAYGYVVIYFHGGNNKDNKMNATWDRQLVTANCSFINGDIPYTVTVSGTYHTNDEVGLTDTLNYILNALLEASKLQ